MSTCPCCGSPMLRHINHNRIYWYCQHCHQEMPNLSFLVSLQQSASRISNPLVALSFEETSREMPVLA